MSVHQIKLVLLGDTAVGKTSIAQRFTYDNFKDNYNPTIGASFMSKPIKIPETDDLLKFEIWDTAGQEMYRSLASFYYRDAGAAILVYDITDPKSFEGIKYWVEQLHQNVEGKIAIAIAGNKCDLYEQEKVELKVAQEYANSINGIFKQTSAKEDIGIEDLFLKLAIQITPQLKDKIQINDTPENDIKDQAKKRLSSKKKPESGKKKCC